MGLRFASGRCLFKSSKLVALINLCLLAADSLVVAVLARTRCAGDDA